MSSPARGLCQVDSNPFWIEAALASVFQVPVFRERELVAAYRNLARHVHPDKTRPVLETLYGRDEAAQFARTFQRLRSAYDDVHSLLFAPPTDYVDPPSNVDAFYTGDECSSSLWIVMDSVASDERVNEYGDPVSWVQIEIPDGVGFRE